MARLSVNLNKIALLRNSRHTGVPDVVEFGRLALAAGAHGLTLHPRPDERHVLRKDVPAVATLLKSRRPKIEFNIEGYPDVRFLKIVTAVKPEQCTLVPDASDTFTSDEGWKLGTKQLKVVSNIIPKLKRLGSRVILFVDPNPAVIAHVKKTGADGIEIYTGGYAEAFRKGNYKKLLEDCGKTADEAHKRGLVVNIGHDLNLKNLPPIVARIPFLAEASIGHELTADALKVGFAAAVRAYMTALTPAGTLFEPMLKDDPLEQFQAWFERAQTSEISERGTMVLSTASKDASPSARIVLLKEFGEDGFVFFTNYESKKGRDLTENPQAALLFHWPSIGLQVRVSGVVSKTSQAESMAYFRSRERESQLGAWASQQSSVIAGHPELDVRVEKLRKQYEGKNIPLPPHWGGYRLVPTEFEFWQGGPNRLHDRVRYEKKGKAWEHVYLSP
jgi:pyridoxine 5-phosphate synthase